jgi:hypothetical protein
MVGEPEAAYSSTDRCRRSRVTLAHVSLLERIRHFWRPPKPDHPLSEQERERLEQPQSGFDVRGELEREYVGEDLDPDDPRSGRL